jgi:hypothetical protein
MNHGILKDLVAKIGCTQRKLERLRNRGKQHTREYQQYADLLVDLEERRDALCQDPPTGNTGF